jgi:trehalose-6-phosphate synthase
VTLQSHDIQIGVFPIGIDAEVIAHEATDAEEHDEQVKRLAQSLLGRQVLLGVDRLDYSTSSLRLSVALIHPFLPIARVHRLRRV